MAVLYALMDVQHTHMGASHVKESFDLPPRDYSKSWTEKCLKMSVLNLQLSSPLATSLNAS